MTDVIRLKPNQYIHVHDNNKNITMLVTGPKTVTLQQHETLILGPKPHISVPPMHYVVIENPVQRTGDGQIVLDKHGSAKVEVGEREIRFSQIPFALYPDEKVIDDVKPLQVLPNNTALVLVATRNFTDENGVARVAGDEWLQHGPGTYLPRVEVDVQSKREAVIVGTNQSLHLRARNKFTDRSGVLRQVGEEWLWSKPGAFMQSVDEQLVRVIDATVIHFNEALHVQVIENFVDERPFAKGVERKAGEVYLMTSAMSETFTPTPCERVVNKVELIKLSKQYAVILDPVGDDGVQQLGRRRVVTDTNFFLKPGERLESGIQDMFVLTADEALLLTAIEAYDDKDTGVQHQPGDKWLIEGPCQYIPHDAARVVERRRRVTLADTEGVYVRNTLSGEVRAVIGQTFMLTAEEELWEKDMPDVVEQKLASQGMAFTTWMQEAKAGRKSRDKTRVVTYSIPHNTLAQVYDYKTRKQRLIFGPDLIMLGPDEHFSVLSLSGSEWDPSRPNVCLPKITNRIKALFLFLGPDSMSDVVHVETSDHARLALQLCYSWYFDVDRDEPDAQERAARCFNVPDFVGDCCSSIASRVRSFVAAQSFDEFHKHSSEIVKRAVFGLDSKGAIKDRLTFKANGLVVSSVDIQEIEVTDEKTRDALQKSVKMAIEITTQGQEASARNEASVREQRARGTLERQVIEDKSACEKERMEVLRLQTENDAIESAGQAKAEARSRAEAANIEGNLRLQLAKVEAETCRINEEQQLAMAREKKQQELGFQSRKDSLEVEFAREIASIEASKFERTMQSVGNDTIKAIAMAGPELQSRLLAGLGLEGYLVTDGTNPINLFNTASGMVGAAAGQRQ
eukprot:PhM_4_TR11533/c0_g1_i1/m.36900/K17266/MVP; major vault protein